MSWSTESTHSVWYEVKYNYILHGFSYPQTVRFETFNEAKAAYDHAMDNPQKGYLNLQLIEHDTTDRVWLPESSL